MNNAGTTWRELTSPRAGGVAVLELRGAGALAEARELARRPQLPLGRAVLCRLRGGRGELLDEGLVLAHSAARVELQLHGSRAVILAVVQELGRRGVGPAGRPGLEERALLRASRSRGRWGAALALAQSDGRLRRRLERGVLLDPQAWAAEVDALLERARAARHLLVPPRVVLCGPPNAGKSTLFNALLGAERALTSPAPGTTRDALVEPCVIDGLEVLLVDTAGTREQAAGDAAAAIERLGQELGRVERATADAVLELVPPGGAPSGAGGAWRVLHGRGDLAGARGAALRPLEDPAGARAAVARELFLALDLRRPEVLARGTLPLEPELGAALESLRTTASCAERWRGLSPLLGDERPSP